MPPVSEQKCSNSRPEGKGQGAAAHWRSPSVAVSATDCGLDHREALADSMAYSSCRLRNVSVYHGPQWTNLAVGLIQVCIDQE